MTPTEILETTPNRLDRLRISAAQLSFYTEINGSQINRWLNRKDHLTFKNCMLIDTTLRTLEALALAANPLPIDFRDIQKVRMLAKKYENGNLEIHIKDHITDFLISGGVAALSGAANG